MKEQYIQNNFMSDVLDDLWKIRNPKDALFLELIKGYEIKESKEYPDQIFYMKNDKILIEYDKKTKDAYINYNLIWSVFSSKFSINYFIVRELMRGLLEAHLKLKGTTPLLFSWGSCLLLEAHLKLKGTTPTVNDIPTECDNT